MKCACGKVHAFDALSKAEQVTELKRVLDAAERGMRDVVVRAVASLDTNNAELVAGAMIAAGVTSLVCQLHGAARLTAGATLMSAHELSVRGFAAAEAHPSFPRLLRAEMTRHVAEALPTLARAVGATATVTHTEEPS